MVYPAVASALALALNLVVSGWTDDPLGLSGLALTLSGSRIVHCALSAVCVALFEKSKVSEWCRVNRAAHASRVFPGTQHLSAHLLW